MILAIIITAVAAYCLGNLNGAVLISKLLEKDDVRRHGSGNAGMTNFFRSYGANNVVFVILVDFGKAALAAYLGKALLGRFGYALEGSVLGGLFVVLGHNFPAAMHFKGGKGIMSSFGASFVIGWPIPALLGTVFLLFYLATCYVSLGSVMAALSLLIAAPFLYADHPIAAAGLMAMALLAIYMHRSNIQRLRKGTESKTYFFRKKESK